MSKIAILATIKRIVASFLKALVVRRKPMKISNFFVIIALLILVPASSILVSAQVDVARKTTAITYPLDEQVTVQFRGTTRFPRMKGDARVKRTGRNGTRIELSVEKMPRPFELGAGYATYVLWAISPTGIADNLGEIRRSGIFFIDSKMSVTTPLQTFSLIITAEPHFLVTRPSQTIMLENLYPVAANGKPIGTSPSISYFGNSSDYFRDPRTPEIAETDYAKTPSAILQAKQAVALARFAGAERDAANELAEAETLLQNATNSWEAGRDTDTIDIAARKSISASVKAESLAVQRKDAREKRNEKIRTDSEIRSAENKFTDAQNQIADVRAELARETRNRELAERDVLNFSNQVKELRDENGKLRDDNARARIEIESLNTRLANAENEKKAMLEQNDKAVKAANAKAAESTLIASLKTFGAVEKNDRGIVVTLPETLWTGPRTSAFMPQSDGKLTSFAEILNNNPDYRIAIESYTDSSGDPTAIQSVTDKRSLAVAEKFASMGIPEGRIVAKGFGASVPVAPNTTVANRAKNRRMLVVLTYYPQ